MNVLQVFVMLFIGALVVVSASDAHNDNRKQSLRHRIVDIPRVLGGDGTNGNQKDRYDVQFYCRHWKFSIFISSHTTSCETSVKEKRAKSPKKVVGHRARVLATGMANLIRNRQGACLNLHKSFSFPLFRRLLYLTINKCGPFHSTRQGGGRH